MKLQVETAKELISTNDATIVGVLLAVIALLIYWVIRQDNKLEKLNEYVRESEKGNLKVMEAITNAVKDTAETSTKNGDKIDNVSDTAKNILSIIKERLKI